MLPYSILPGIGLLWYYSTGGRLRPLFMQKLALYYTLPHGAEMLFSRFQPYPDFACIRLCFLLAVKKSFSLHQTK